MPRASDRVHDALRRELLEGALAPGDAVPSERVLAERFGVNRHAVREALKRLEQAELVRITQGGPTRVLDWREGAGLEVLLDLVVGAGGPPPVELARSVLEMRASVGIDAARRCATRAGEAERARLAEAATAAAGLVGVAEAELDDAYAALWRGVVAGSGNVAYRLALNSLVAALDAHPEVVALVRPTDPGLVRALGVAIADGDGEGAANAARGLLERDADALA